MWFDRFKAAMNIPIFPKAATKGCIQSTGKLAPPTDVCFGTLAVETETASIFDSNSVVVTVPEPGIYYHPAVTNHPMIDRAVMDVTAEHFIIYQDKINNNASEAVAGLVGAAQILKPVMPNCEVVCVAHVTGASHQIRAQVNFEAMAVPYLMITRDDLKAFYTPTISPIFEYLMLRHSTSNAPR